MDQTYDAKITVIGAGVVGLAIAAKLSLHHQNLFVLEKHPRFGQETSSRNSEVIHSGIYYPQNSLKTRLCIRGNELMYAYCLEHNVNHQRIGKLVVATNAAKDVLLQKLFIQAKQNGVARASFLSSAEVASLEPSIYCTSAIFFPDTGIVDSHGLMKQLEHDILKQGAQVAYNSEVTDITTLPDGYKLTIQDDKGQFDFTTRYLINAAGLQSDHISRMSQTFQPEYQLSYWKGEYFAMGNGKNAKINHLIYPVPDPNSGGVGIHVTLDLTHRAKLGPNAIYLPDKKQDYQVNPNHQSEFFGSARTFLPFLEMDDICPDQAGIRPKLTKPGEPFRDFIIRNENGKGHPNLINLIGIESPGLTSCLAIAEYVLEMVGLGLYD